MQDKTSLTLHQRSNNGEERQFELKAGRELHVINSKKDNRTVYAFSILALQDEGQRVNRYQQRWLWLALLMITSLLMMPSLQQYFPATIEQYMLSVFSALFFGALLFLMLLLRSFSRSCIFYSKYTNLPLLEFWINKPSRKEYEHFVSVLENSIKQLKQDMQISYDKQLAGELRTLRRVTEAGLLSESVYIAAKAKLLILSDTPYRPADSQE